MSELAEHLLLLGRTLGEEDNFTEYYRAANVTISARFCRDDIQLEHFIQGLYNDSMEYRFDKEASSPDCIVKLNELGMTDRGCSDPDERSELFSKRDECTERLKQLRKQKKVAVHITEDNSEIKEKIQIERQAQDRLYGREPKENYRKRGYLR